MRSVYLILSLCLLTVLTAMNVEAKNIYGLYEKVQLEDVGDLTIKAKLDTGALTSSFGATNIEFFEKDGKNWVRFKPQVKALDLPAIEKEVVRESKIKIRHDDLRLDSNISHTKRPVVLMNICFDGKTYEIEVNLTDRSRFNYPLLLGSSSLTQLNAIIDPSLKFESKTKKCTP